MLLDRRAVASSVTPTRLATALSRPSVREAIEGYLFISPWLIGFVVLTAGPMLAAFVLSFTNYDVVSTLDFVGLQNFSDILTNDQMFFIAVRVTIIYVLVSVPIGIALSFAIALLLNQPIAGQRVLRTVYYLPSLVSGVAVSILWIWIFQPDFGVLNTFLKLVGIQGPKWLFSEDWALPALILMSFWSVGGPLFIYLAALQAIPTNLYRAASVDGANWWMRFRYITVPMMTPILFFNLVMGIIASFQTFTAAYVMTQGGPNHATLFYILYLYQNAFQYLKMGYAAALALILFAIILFFTLLVFRSSAAWVYYESWTQRREP
jgi:multiple sugar transport system permease protein